MFLSLGLCLTTIRTEIGDHVKHKRAVHFTLAKTYLHAVRWDEFIIYQI